MANGPRLAILATTPAYRRADGRIALSRKFLDGVLEYHRNWPGSIKVHMEPASGPLPTLDSTLVDAVHLPFQLEIGRLDLPSFARLLSGSPVVVLAILANRHIALQRAAGDVRWIWFAEWSLATRKQIAVLSTANPLIRGRRIVSAHLREVELRRAVQRSAGIQCNGTPAYEQYRHLNPNCLLYFDTRLTRGMLANAADIDARIAEYHRSSRLRLVYSGRLVLIKGVDHLIQVAKELRRLELSFELSLCGDGDLMPQLQAIIRSHHLADLIHVRGVLDFATELVPFVKRSADLFVCCHRQGDPSSTYLETLGCGVPIVGYANEALVGLAARSGAAWVVPTDRPDLLAHKIVELARAPERIRDAATRGLDFARHHTFEQTFRARTEHLLASAC